MHYKSPEPAWLWAFLLDKSIGYAVDIWAILRIWLFLFLYVNFLESHELE